MKIVIAMFLFFHIFHASAATFGTNDTDYLALLCIKSKISQDPQGVMNSWNDTLHFCQWEGVRCGHRHKRVTALNLSSRGLVGSLSPHLGNLSFLREIRFRNNTLGGGIPPEIGGLFRLQQLSLSSNSFEGEIPTNLSRCTNLTFLGLHHNKLVGKIPIELTSLWKLKVLSINDNDLTGGGIPPSIGNLTFLESLSLRGCGSGGSIPNVFHKMGSLRELGLGGNNLIGTIPSSIYNLSFLEIFSFGLNQLTGILPTNLGLMLPHLQILELGDNNFTGFLPPSISNCSDLDTISITSNHFHGKVAINFGNLQNLKWVYLSDNNLGSGERDEMKFINSLSNCSNLIAVEIVANRFKGMLPDQLGNFSAQFRNFNLAQNYLYGTLPSSLGNLFSLTSLLLQENQFTGTIPITIGMLENIQMLSLDTNILFGSIPDSIGNLSLLVQLSLSYNQLGGTIPSSLGNCHNLQFLSLSQNKLSGRIPKQIFQLSSLSIGLALGRNHLSGPIPVEVGNLKNIGQLSLEENNLSGELPNTLGRCIVLEWLDLSSNFFQGSISTSLGSLRSLIILNVSHNNFSGLIPRILQEIPLENLDISFNNFEGEVPKKGVFVNSSAVSVVGNHKLCGGMPTLQLGKCNFKDSKRPQRLSVVLKVVISMASALVGLAILSFILFHWFKMKRNDQPSELGLKESLLKVSYENLLKATNGFSLENLIGVGAFASVYKGVLDEDGLTVAVKVLNLQHRGGLKSFVKECDALRHVRHRNLVKVITCCSSIDFQGNDFRALVYEFMQNGSLDRWLYSSPSTSNDVPRLDLLQRISVAIDVACALEYLHHSSGLPIVHCDLKPSNILLDSDMVARVGDFGLAKLLLPENSNANASSTSGIKGTVGYTPPEYGLGNEVSTKGDVYSYGILLLEMMIGKRPTDPLFQESLNLHNHASMGITNRELEIVEPMIVNGNNEECLISMLKIGVACSVESPQERMNIHLVIKELNILKGTLINDYDCVS